MILVIRSSMAHPYFSFSSHNFILEKSSIILIILKKTEKKDLILQVCKPRKYEYTIFKH